MVGDEMNVDVETKVAAPQFSAPEMQSQGWPAEGHLHRGDKFR